MQGLSEVLRFYLFFLFWKHNKLILLRFLKQQSCQRLHIRLLPKCGGPCRFFANFVFIRKLSTIICLLYFAICMLFCMRASELISRTMLYVLRYIFMIIKDQKETYGYIHSLILGSDGWLTLTYAVETWTKEQSFCRLRQSSTMLAVAPTFTRTAATNGSLNLTVAAEWMTISTSDWTLPVLNDYRMYAFRIYIRIYTIL